MNKLILSLLLVTTTSVAWAEPPTPIEKAIDYKIGDYVELKDGRQGTIKSIIKIPAVGETKLLTYEIAFTEFVDSNKIEKKFSKRKPIELGDVVLYLPRKLLADVTGVEIVEGKKVWKLKPVSDKDIENITAVETDIWDGNVVWMQMGNERVMPEFINEADGTLIYGDKAKWDSMPDNFKELPPVKEKKPEPDPRRRGRFSGRKK